MSFFTNDITNIISHKLQFIFPKSFFPSPHQCLYDGFDCEPEESCHPNYEAYCKKHWNNNNCDQGCNSMACGYDGFDCEQGPPEYATGYLVVVVMVPPEVFANNTVGFLRDLGRLLHVVVTVAKDQNGNDMIYPYSQDEINLGSRMGGSNRIKRFLEHIEEDDAEQQRKKRAAAASSVMFGSIQGTRVYLRIDIRKCDEGTAKEDNHNNRCFHTIKEAAEYLQTIIEGDLPLEIDFPVMTASAVIDATPTLPPPSAPGFEYIVAVCLAVLLVVAIIGVLVTVNRKRQRGTTWFPEGFIQTFKPKGKNASRNSGVSVRRGPDGEEMKHIHGSQVRKL